MRPIVLAAALLSCPVAVAAQAPAVPVPPGVRAEGVPPIPADLPDALAPYADARRAVLYGWHPVRKEILISTTFGSVAQVHSVAGPGMARRQLTFFRDAPATVAAYEPVRGDYFVIRKDSAGGAESSQLYRYDIGSGRSTMITDGQSRYGVPVWANRAGLVAFESSRRNGKDRDLYVMDPMKPGSLRMLGEFPAAWSVAAWSPDDRELIAIQAFTNTRHALWRVNVESGEKTRLTPADGEGAAWSAPQYTPDGRAVYALSNFESGRRRVWRSEVATGQWTPVTRDTEEVDGFALSPDGRTLAVMFDRGDASVLELIDTATMTVRVRPGLPAALLDPRGAMQWHPDSSEVGFTLWSLRTFGDVFSVNARTGQVSRWTTSEVGAFNPDELPEPRIVRWTSFDGRPIPGVLYMPPARFTGPRPVMINIHGGPDGPNARERPRYQGRSAYFLNEMGVAILYPNVRGSYGFGREFEALDDGAKREDAVRDIGAALDWIAAESSLDQDRVMVTGFSYGGYMTYAVAAAYPDRIRCAFAAAGISDFISYMETTEPQRLPGRRAEYGDERDPAMREVFKRISPLTNASRIRTPLMILHGAKDTRVPLAQAEEMARAAAANGAPVWKVVFEDEGHAMFVRRENNDFTFYAWILFMERFLLD